MRSDCVRASLEHPSLSGAAGQCVGKDFPWNGLFLLALGYLGGTGKATQRDFPEPKALFQTTWAEGAAWEVHRLGANGGCLAFSTEKLPGSTCHPSGHLHSLATVSQQPLKALGRGTASKQLGLHKGGDLS